MKKFNKIIAFALAFVMSLSNIPSLTNVYANDDNDEFKYYAMVHDTGDLELPITTSGDVTVKNGTNELTEDTDYSIVDNIISIKGSYISELDVDTVEFAVADANGVYAIAVILDTDGSVAYYALGEDYQNTGDNSNFSTGVATGTPAFSNGYTVLDGSSYISFDGNADATKAFTASIKTYLSTYNNTQHLLAFSEDVNTGRIFYHSNAKTKFGSFLGSSPVKLFGSSPSLSTWYTLTVTYDGTDKLNYYIDGELVSVVSAADSSTIGSPVTIDSSYLENLGSGLTIGTSGGLGSSDKYWSGGADDFVYLDFEADADLVKYLHDGMYSTIDKTIVSSGDDDNDDDDSGAVTEISTQQMLTYTKNSATDFNTSIEISSEAVVSDKDTTLVMGTDYKIEDGKLTLTSEYLDDAENYNAIEISIIDGDVEHEVRILVSSEDDEVAYFAFNGNYSNTGNALDMVEYYSNSGDPTFINDEYLYLDGTDDAIIFDHSIDTTSAFTFSVETYIVAKLNTQHLISFSTTEGDGNGRVLSHANSKSDFTTMLGGSSLQYNSPTSTVIKKWYTVAITYNGSNTLNVYVDGENTGTYTVDSSEFQDLGEYLYLGKSGIMGDFDKNWNGYVENLTILNYEADGDLIKYLYDGTIAEIFEERYIQHVGTEYKMSDYGEGLTMSSKSTEDFNVKWIFEDYALDVSGNENGYIYNKSTGNYLVVTDGNLSLSSEKISGQTWTVYPGGDSGSLLQNDDSGLWLKYDSDTYEFSAIEGTQDSLTTSIPSLFNIHNTAYVAPTAGGDPTDVYITIDGTNVSRQISDELLGIHFVYPIETDSIYNERVLDWISDNNVWSARFPGGTVLKYWDWENPTGAFKGDARDEDNYSFEYGDPSNNQMPATTEEYWMSVDEYLDICEYTGMEPMMGINIRASYSGVITIAESIDSAIRLMEYCEARGFEIEDWFIGNEETHNTTYYSHFNQLSAAMREHATEQGYTIKVIANNNSLNSSNVKTMITNLGDNVDIAEYHSKWYGYGTTATVDMWLSEYPLFDGDLETEVANIRAAIESTSNTDVLIANNEWGATEANVGFDKYQTSLVNLDYLLAIYRAGFDQASFWNMQWSFYNPSSNQEYMHMLDYTRNYEFNPIALGFEMLSSAELNYQLDLVSNQPAVYGFADVDTDVDGEQDTYEVYFMNKFEEEANVIIDITNEDMSEFEYIKALVMTSPGVYVDTLETSWEQGKLTVDVPELSFVKVILSKTALDGVDTEELDRTIKAFDKLVDINYTDDSYSAALAARNTAEECFNEDQTTVDLAVATLKAKIDALEEVVIKTVLETSVAEFDHITADDCGAGWATFETYMNAAKAIIADENATQEEVIEANLNLRGHYFGSLGNKIAIREKIAIANELTESNYTSSSWATMQSALSSANTLSDNASASYTNLWKGWKTLGESIDNLIAADNADEYLIKFIALYQTVQQVETTEHQVSSLPTAQDRDGYDFVGWYTDDNIEVTEDTIYATTTSVTAIYVLSESEDDDEDNDDGTIYYTVNFESNGGSTVTSQTVEGNTVASAPDSPAKSGYSFVGWYADSGLETAWNFETEITSDTTLYAKWSKNSTSAPDVYVPSDEETDEEIEEEIEEEIVDEEIGAEGYEDITEGDWYYDCIIWATENGIMNGTSTNAFTPNGEATRSMIWTILARFSNIDTSTGETWDQIGREWVIESNISDGTNGEMNITRQDLVTMLYRYFEQPTATADLSAYPDADDISSWAVDAMKWAIENGIITGNTDGTLSPLGNATRAEIAIIFMRLPS